MVETMTVFTATATRSGDWWVVQCDQHPAALSQVRSLGSAASTHAEAIAFVTGTEVSDQDVTVTVVLPTDLAELFDEVQRLRAEADERSVAAAARWRQLVTDLTESGWSFADTARALHVSPQRVSQLIEA